VPQDSHFFNLHGLLECYPTGNDYGIFSNLRFEYWRERYPSEPERLYRYYDLHQDVQIPKFDPSRISVTNTILDIASTILSFIALNAPAQSAKGIYSSFGSQLLGGTSGINSFANGDSIGGWLSVGGFAPPPFGTISSGASVIYDVSAGFYSVPYVPPIPR
jgi:hypothetical protein